MKLTSFLKTTASFLLFTGLLSGCASNPVDPYEKFNRPVYKFNNFIDRIAYRPAAQAYDKVTPKFVRRGIHNFFANVYQVPVIINDTLQLNVPLAMQDIGRLAVNTTLGIGGWFDVAKHMGAPAHDQDFGITLARWGWKDSSYLLLPFFPPGTPRDIIGTTVDYTFFLPWVYVKPIWIPYSVYALTFIDKRASFLPTDQLVKESFDPYVFVRDAYLQNRKRNIERALQPYGKEDASMSLSDNSQDVSSVAADDSKKVENPSSSPSDTQKAEPVAAKDNHGTDSGVAQPVNPTQVGTQSGK